MTPRRRNPWDVIISAARGRAVTADCSARTAGCVAPAARTRSGYEGRMPVLGPGERALLLLAAACGSLASCRPVRSTGPIDRAPLRPAQLTYRMVHQGDHTPWRGMVHVSIDRDAAAGRPLWRRSFRIEAEGSRPITITGVAVVGDGPAQIESSGVWDTEKSRAVWHDKELVGETSNGAGAPRPIRVKLPAPLALDFGALDIALPLLPLAPGYETRVWLVDENPAGWTFRPFAVSVRGPETIRVPAGTFSALRVSLAPLDGNPRMRSTFHVQSSSPRVVVRKEYLVNPETKGPVKRSAGVEELVSVRWK
jgi:hypothetical protein